MTNVEIILQHFPDTITFLWGPIVLHMQARHIHVVKKQDAFICSVNTGNVFTHFHTFCEAWYHMQIATNQEELGQEELGPGHTTTN